ncbi:MAG: hypothetical protein WCQ70_05945 [Lentimicrobiaceae bacterium]
MKKLQSLQDFKASGLSQKFMSKLYGGENTTPTKGGCNTTDNLDRTSTGVYTFTSDECDTTGGIIYHGVADVKTCPED